MKTSLALDANPPEPSNMTPREDAHLALYHFRLLTALASPSRSLGAEEREDLSIVMGDLLERLAAALPPL